jgi:hypothetical protein
MPRKTITIFITTFIIVGAIILGVYYWINKEDTSTTTNETPWYQNFNPFGTSDNIVGDKVEPNGEDIGNQIPEGGTQTSKFYQITDFAIAGSTFLEDTRPIIQTPIEEKTQPQEIKTIISPTTKEGRKEIQVFLNMLYLSNQLL